MAPAPTPANEPAKGIPFGHPANLLATWFGVGRLPVVPGTWGSLAALPVAWVLALYYGPYAVLGAAVAVFLLGLWSCRSYLARTRTKDPGEIVIDEVSGQLIAAAPAGLDPLAFLLSFVLFRILDVMKPWPCRALEDLPGALGVIADDIAAGLYAAVLIGIYFAVLGKPNAFF
ncbi:MAG: phosphatidylglycerophosphatase A [Alphaproteobacteria bacterium]